MYCREGWPMVVEVWRGDLEKLYKRTCKLKGLWDLPWEYETPVWPCDRLVERMGLLKNIWIGNYCALGPLVCDRVFKRLNYLHGLLHDCSLFARRRVQWVLSRTIQHLARSNDRLGLWLYLFGQSISSRLPDSRSLVVGNEKGVWVLVSYGLEMFRQRLDRKSFDNDFV